MLVFLSLLLTALSAFATGTTTSGQLYKPEDITAITLYGAGTKYRPDLCPSEISFMARASALPGLSPGRLGLLPSDVMMDGSACTADVSAIDMFPIGLDSISKTTTMPPQWVLEDASMQERPINFTCGSKSYAVMYAYLNDVKAHDGKLDPNIVYLDFAVYPYVKPFSYCAYANRKEGDNIMPLYKFPFPAVGVWNRTRAIIQKNSVQVPESQTQDSTARAAATFKSDVVSQFISKVTTS